MKRPLIGITTYGRIENGRYNLPAEYVDAVRRAGGLPFLLAPGENDPIAWLDVVDGVILSGGGDIDPACYQGKMHKTIYNLDKERDDTELKFAEILLKKKVPTLAICRGIQVINVLLGGSLIEHIPDEFGEKVAHRQQDGAPTTHTVTIDPQSRLAKILNTTECEIGSLHHQAIRTPAKDAKVISRAADGIIEAIEFDNEPQLIAIQWHPELTADKDPIQQKLFRCDIRRSSSAIHNKWVACNIRCFI